MKIKEKLDTFDMMDNALKKYYNGLKQGAIVNSKRNC